VAAEIHPFRPGVAALALAAAGGGLLLRFLGPRVSSDLLTDSALVAVTALSAAALLTRSGRGRGRKRAAGPRRDVRDVAATAATGPENEARALLDSARVLMWLSGPDGRRTFLNRSWLEFTGRSRDDEIGNGWTSGVHPDDVLPLRRASESATETGFEVEYRLRRFDGEYRWVHEEARPRGAAGAPSAGFVGSCVDVTERRLREAALLAEREQLARIVEERTSELSRANAELEKASRLKDQFLANVSHELRTPLTAILGLSEALLDEPGAAPEKRKRALETIEESGRHLLSLINELLDLAKIEAGQMKIEMVEGVSGEAIAQGSLRFVKEAAQKKRVTVALTMEAPEVTLRCDERRMKQVLVNLLGNAVKFTPEGGNVGLEVALDRMEGAIHFTVWDTGIGIHKADMGRLFAPFVQIDGSMTRQYGGTGLGLALSRRMVELHGGRLVAGSSPGKGSRFTVVLPWSADGPAAERAEPAPAREEAAPRAGTSTPAQRILLVEDNTDLLAMLDDHLRAHGHSVVSARSGAEGVELARQERPDLILMDIQLPESDGLEAIRRIRALDGFARTPILALTALAMPGDRERCLAAGATDYESKPLRLARLREWIDRVARNS
jgi:PAS domain S-box-containing protein